MSTPACRGDGTLMSEASYGSFFAFCSIAFRLAFCASILARSSGDTLFAVWIVGDIRPLSVAVDLSPYGTARTTRCHRAAILPESVGVVKRHGPGGRRTTDTSSRATSTRSSSTVHEGCGIRCGLSIRCRCSDGSNFRKPLDCVLVVPADGSFPCGRRLRGDVVRDVVETGGVVRQHQVEVGDVDVRLVPVDQRDPVRGHADVARVVGIAVDDAYRTSDEPRPRCSASGNAVRRHRAEVDLRPGLGVQEVGRRPPARALGPALRQQMQLAERVGHTVPVGLRFWRSALYEGHHHQTVGEQPAVRRRDRHRHGQTFTVEVLEELGLPGEISVAPGTETTDRQPPVDAHAPHVVGDSASEWFDASDVVTPLPKCRPSHWLVPPRRVVSFLVKLPLTPGLISSLSGTTGIVALYLFVDMSARRRSLSSQTFSKTPVHSSSISGCP